MSVECEHKSALTFVFKGSYVIRLKLNHKLFFGTASGKIAPVVVTGLSPGQTCVQTVTTLMLGRLEPVHEAA